MAQNTLITNDRLEAMTQLAAQAPAEGFFAEVGVYKGGSLRNLAEAFPGRNLLGFDSFEGLPQEHWMESEIHQPGEFADTSLAAVTGFLKDCKNVQLVAGIFPATAKAFENLSFSFVHIDTDFYLSVKACLEWFWPRMLPGGILVLDDYLWPNCPGVERALEEFGKPYRQTTAAYQAFLIKD